MGDLMAGLSVDLTGTEVQSRLGEIARSVHVALGRVADGADFLAHTDDSTLLSLYGISNGDAAVLRSAFGDLTQLAAVYRGTATQATQKDFTAFAGRIFGLGFE
jgi:hypothetical protein